MDSHQTLTRKSLFVTLLAAALLLAACAPSANTPQPTPTDVAQAASDEFVTPPELAGEQPPPGVEGSFSTDFSRHTVSYREVISGGPPKDAIPAIDNPQFIALDEADTWLKPKEPVIVLQVDEAARAYPLQILTWHEIVNDEINGQPVAVTFCPLCNTAIVFDARFGGLTLDFGTTGRLRLSNLIMYDRQTETWWQQATGEAIAGLYAGQQLSFLPAAITSWQEFKTSFPDGLVLSRDTGFSRSYGRNPYSGYDDISNTPFLFQGPDNSDRLPAMQRVLTIDLGEEAVAYPYDALSSQGVVNDEVAGQPVTVFWVPGTQSAFSYLNNPAAYRDVGAANAFSRVLDGQTLSFTTDGEAIFDEQTGSAWNVLGQAVSGELLGSELQPVVSINHFWFSWAAFKPETRIYRP